MLRFLFIALTVIASCSAFGTEREVKIPNAKASVTLAGTLSIPDGVAPRGVMILASGSGAQNRDEEILGLKPSKVLSDTLTAAGYAVLRMDDRGVGESTGSHDDALIVDFVSDIESGLQFVDSCFKNIPKGIVGHSMGGTIAIKLGARHACDFIITLGAPAWSGDSIVMSQSRAISEAMIGHWDSESLQRQILDVAKSTQPVNIASSAIYMLMATRLGDAIKLPDVQQHAAAQIKAVLSPWYRDMLRYDPADDISRVDIPWLAVNGEKDIQVLPGNLTTISQLNPSATVVNIPRHNHLLQQCVTGLPREYSNCGKCPSDTALGIILNWLQARI